MTVGIAIKCVDGLIVASDSLSTFGRGAPVSKSVAKIHSIEHVDLENPVVVLGAGGTAFVDKFLDRIRRNGIANAAFELKRKLDVVDFAERVCEITVTTLFKEYAIERREFLGIPSDYSIGLIVAGITRDGELRAFHIHPDGLSENIPDYGTVGSGAAYAELFLREIVDDKGVTTTVKDAQNLAVYSVKGAELMDPNVGGKAHLTVLKVERNKAKDGTAAGPDPADAVSPKYVLKIETIIESDEADEAAKHRIREILKEMGKKMRTLIREEPIDEKSSAKTNGADEQSRIRNVVQKAD
jgi:20S proteasome alpha/beta subunit